MNYNSALNLASKILSKRFIKTAQLDSEIILSKIVNLNRAQLLTNLDKKLSNQQLKNFKNLIERRKKRNL